MATNTIKRLHQGYLPTSAAAVLWTPTASTTTMIKSIQLINHGATTESVQLYINASGSPANSASVVKLQLGAGESAEYSGTMVMNSGEEMYGSTTTVSTVSIVVHGMEML